MNDENNTFYNNISNTENNNVEQSQEIISTPTTYRYRYDHGEKTEVTKESSPTYHYQNVEEPTTNQTYDTYDYNTSFYTNVNLEPTPKKKKFKMYISPLVYLNIDDDNRINLTDIRLLRRMVRDNRTRGYSPSKTLASWCEVRNGEEKYVFPYQDNADVIFNTFLAYELAVLKIYAEPLLYKVTDDDPEYLTAIRLIRLLDLVFVVNYTMI